MGCYLDQFSIEFCKLSMITLAVPDFSQSVIGSENFYHHLNQSD